MAWMSGSEVWAWTNRDRYGRRRRFVGLKVSMVEVG